MTIKGMECELLLMVWKKQLTRLTRWSLLLWGEFDRLINFSQSDICIDYRYYQKDYHDYIYIACFQGWKLVWLSEIIKMLKWFFDCDSSSQRFSVPHDPPGIPIQRSMHSHSSDRTSLQPVRKYPPATSWSASAVKRWRQALSDLRYILWLVV